MVGNKIWIHPVFKPLARIIATIWTKVFVSAGSLDNSFWIFDQRINSNREQFTQIIPSVMTAYR
jgi:hypothetical protein